MNWDASLWAPVLFFRFLGALTEQSHGLCPVESLSSIMSQGNGQDMLLTCPVSFSDHGYAGWAVEGGAPSCS